jgi:ferredoxin
MLSIVKASIRQKRNIFRPISSSIIKFHNVQDITINKKNDPKVTFRFLEEKNGDLIEVKAVRGVSVLDVALDYNVDIEGACGGQMACSTCHVILDKKLYDHLPSKQEEEDDMLDLAWGLTDTSRLCCQIKVTDLLEGQTFKIPKDTHNLL